MSDTIKFTFFKSYYDAMVNLPAEDFKKVICAMCSHAFYDKDDEELTGTQQAIYLLILPVLNKSIKLGSDRGEAGKKGGEKSSKQQANDKQTESNKQANDKQNKSKLKANDKQTESNKQADKDIGIGVKDNGDKELGDKEMDNTPLYPPEGESEWDCSKHSNVENTKHILNTGKYAESDYIKDNNLWEIIKDWMEYKDAKTPKKDNHYVTEKAVKSLLTEIVNNAKRYGREATIKAIEHSMGQTWLGISWNGIEKYNRKPRDSNNEWGW